MATIRSSAARIIRARSSAEAAPAAERRHQPRRGLRVELVGGEDHVGEEAIASPLRSWNARWLAPNAPSSERSRFGLARVKSGWASSRCTAFSVSSRRRQRLDREPFVEHQGIALVALVESGERRLAAPARRYWRGRRARPGGRSCCRPRRTGCSASAGRVGGARGHQIAERHRAQPPRALGRRRKFEAVGGGRGIGRAPERLERPGRAWSAAARARRGSRRDRRSPSGRR